MNARRISPPRVFFAFAFVSLIAPSTLFCQSNARGVGGKWVGTLDIVRADGSVEPGDAFLSLSQDGDTVTGTAGKDAQKESPISAGKAGGDAVAFDVVVNPQMTVKFHLSLQGDHLRGTAVGVPVEQGASIQVDTVRADAEGKTAAPVAHVPDRLFQNIAEQDKRLFDAYNHCDLDTLGAMVTDDLEFYHDKTGLAVGRKVFVDSIKNNICGKTQRVLVPGSMEVDRLNQYGAVETGIHRFQHPGHEEEGIGEAKFITVWRFKDGEWKVSRVISYDHHSEAK
jgi:ketosteroid isomerase-like protein